MSAFSSFVYLEVWKYDAEKQNNNESNLDDKANS